VPLTGTSVRNAQPSCNNNGPTQLHLPSATAVSTGRPWKKCPENRRRDFREALLDKMSMEEGFSHLSSGGSVREGLSGRKFSVLDGNADGYLSRKELRPFRAELRADPRLKLCGKRIQLHCDSDGDRRISRREWSTCLGLAPEGDSSSLLLPRRPAGEGRGGLNPLHRWLKGD